MPKKKIAFEFNPFKNVEVPRNKRKEARKAIAEFVLESVLSDIGGGRSPVKNGAWKRSLSPGYRERKKQKSSSLFANLELSGDMLDALEVSEKGSRLELKITGKEADKAEGNLLGSYGGKPDRSKAREFIPKGNQTFSDDIWDGIDRIARRAKKDDRD